MVTRAALWTQLTSVWFVSHVLGFVGKVFIFRDWRILLLLSIVSGWCLHACQHSKWLVLARLSLAFRTDLLSAEEAELSIVRRHLFWLNMANKEA